MIFKGLGYKSLEGFLTILKGHGYDLEWLKLVAIEMPR
jgi:hypothetical protein